MATLRKHIYTVREKLHFLSDDQLFTNRYIAHLINTNRSYLLQQKYSDYRKVIPESMLQTIEFEVERAERVLGIPGDYILVSKKDIPLFANLERIVNSVIISGRDFMESRLNFVNYDRFLWVGEDRWLSNMVYASIRDKKLYLKSGNFAEKGIEVLNLTTVFEDPEEAYNMSITYDPTVSFYDVEYPLSGNLMNTIVNMIRDDFLKGKDLKEDERNNASPD